jgi:hypothetical protein
VLVAISDSASLRPKTVTILFYVPLRVDQRLKASGFETAIKTLVLTDDLACSGDMSEGEPVDLNNLCK